MGLDAKAMQEVENNKLKRKALLANITSKPFNIENQEHLDFLKEEVNVFERNAHLMHLLDGFRSGWKLGFNDGKKVWGANLIIQFVLNSTFGYPRLLNWAGYGILLTSFIGYIFEHCKMNDFAEQVKEMRAIYTWVFNKVGDNSDKLALSDVRRMTKSLAPLCDVNFMVRWPEVATDAKGPDIFSVIGSYGATAFNIFSRKNTPPVDDNDAQKLKLDIHQLKLDVQNNHFKIGSLLGIKNACEYFALSQEFRDMVAELIPKPIKTTTAILVEAAFKK